MAEKPGIRFIVSCWLADNEYDGLVNVDLECGCSNKDLMPCDEPDIENCTPAYQHSDGQFYLIREEDYLDEQENMND